MTRAPMIEQALEQLVAQRDAKLFEAELIQVQIDHLTALNVRPESDGD